MSPHVSPLVRRLAIVAGALGVLLALGHVLRQQLGIDLSVDPEAVRHFAERMGPVAPLLFVLVVAGRALLWLPSQVVLIAAGLCFGTGVGALVGGAGLLLSGLVLFTLARYAGQEAVERRIGRRGRRLFDLAAKRRGAIALAVASSYPLAPLSPLQASAGLTAMPLASFIPAAFVGGTVRASTYAFFGDAMIDLASHQIIGALAFAAAVVVLPLATPAGRRFMRSLVAADDSPDLPD